MLQLYKSVHLTCALNNLKLQSPIIYPVAIHSIFIIAINILDLYKSCTYRIVSLKYAFYSIVLNIGTFIIVTIAECMIDLVIQSSAIKSSSRHDMQFPREYVGTRKKKREIVSSRIRPIFPFSLKSPLSADMDGKPVLNAYASVRTIRACQYALLHLERMWKRLLRTFSIVESDR